MIGIALTFSNEIARFPMIDQASTPDRAAQHKRDMYYDWMLSRYPRIQSRPNMTSTMVT